jgi:uncharacterized phage protein (predicted DNA packaging)
VPQVIATLDELKSHLRVEHDDENHLITQLIEAAVEYLSNETGTDWVNTVPTPKLIRAAVLLLVGHWFTNREATSPLQLREVPMGVQRIIDQFRVVEPS